MFSLPRIKYKSESDMQTKGTYNKALWCAMDRVTPWGLMLQYFRGNLDSACGSSSTKFLFKRANRVDDIYKEILIM